MPNRRKLTRRQERLVIRKVALRARLSNKALARQYGCSVSTIQKTTGWTRLKRERLADEREQREQADREAARRQIDAFPTPQERPDEHSR